MFKSCVKTSKLVSFQVKKDMKAQFRRNPKWVTNYELKPLPKLHLKANFEEKNRITGDYNAVLAGQDQH